MFPFVFFLCFPSLFLLFPCLHVDGNITCNITH
jgi:hypothetical protein